MKKLLKITAVLAGSAGIVDSVIAASISNVNLGTITPGLAGAILIIYAIFYSDIKNLCANKLNKFIFRLFNTALALFVISFAVCSGILIKYSHSVPQNGADAVIVLGAGLRGENVSQALAYRLDAAIQYQKNNPEAIIVVSGGQGENEIVTEAYAMKRYLINNGIDESKILTEEKSSRTLENFTFSKAILDSRFKNKDYKIVFSTNGFHIFRAGLLAEKAGFNAQGLAAKSTPFLTFNFYVREYFSVIKYCLLDHNIF